MKRIERINPKEFGEWMLKERRTQGISRMELARRADVDVSTIFTYENYGHIPRVDNYLRILSALGYEEIVRSVNA